MIRSKSTIAVSLRLISIVFERSSFYFSPCRVLLLGMNQLIWDKGGGRYTCDRALARTHKQTHTHTRHAHTHTQEVANWATPLSLSLLFDSALYLQRYWSGASRRVSRFGLEPPIGQLVSILMHIVFFPFSVSYFHSVLPFWLYPSLLGV